MGERKHTWIKYVLHPATQDAPNWSLISLSGDQYYRLHFTGEKTETELDFSIPVTELMNGRGAFQTPD